MTRRLERRLVAVVLSVWPLAAAPDQDLLRFVNPFIGTGDGAPDYSIGNSAGNTPPGAAYPLGMVLWSPDTTNEAGGYRYSHNVIHGFSLTHISGRGISCYQDAPFLPMAGPVKASPGTNWNAYGATFQHANEAAAPGYYGVRLDNGIQVELSVTRRTGFARFDFGRNRYGSILVNAGGSAQGSRDGGTNIAFIGPRRIGGSVESGDCGGWFSYRVYFVAEFDRAFQASGTWMGNSVEAGRPYAEGSRSGAYVSFDTSVNAVVQVRVGLSYVSMDKALRNLRQESRVWSLEGVCETASAAWNARLNSIQVTGGTEDQKTVFYTALYHSLLHPNIFGDHDGEYLGFDNQVYQDTRRTQYHNFASWDLYRTQILLLALIAPETSDMMQSLVNDAQQDPSGGLPRWQHANTNSGGMIGDGQDSVIASAYALGARDFDTAGALAAMEKGADRIGTTSAGALVRFGLPDYVTLGYVSTANPYSGSLTLEYATNDFSIARFAKALGDDEKSARYLARAQNWRNLFHDGYLVPRRPDGRFLQHDDPGNSEGFCEGSLAQYSWMVPFNLRGLFDLMGGNAAVTQRLDEFFSRFNAGPWDEYAFIGNAPSLKSPWAYAFAGAPWRTQEVVRRILLSQFRNTPGGMPGNDDLGVLSSWAVFAAVGLYPHTPGVGGFIVSGPLFPSVTIRLAGGGELRIDAPEAEAGKPYVRSLKVNGAEYGSAWVPWDMVSAGGILELAMSGTPDTQWAAGSAAAPPSFDAGQGQAGR
jgi:predicted alpha-1,2-mannosidase